MRKRTAVHSFLALFLLTPIASASLPTILTTFGDSLSDVGNTNNLTFGLSPGSGYFNGRYSNGPVWDEILSSDLGLGVVNYSRNGGRDYAYGGAEVGTGSTISFIFSIPRTGSQISTYLGQHTPNPTNELFVLWGGANNFLNNSSTDPATVVSSLSTEITSLANAGAKRFLIPNLPRLGEIPRYRGTSNEILYNNLSLTFDSDLAAALPTLSSSLNITIQPLDIQTLFDQALSEPSAFGLTDTTDQAKAGVANPDQYLFWDDVHPTRVMHSLLGNVAYDLVAQTTAHTWNANADTAHFATAANWSPIGLPSSIWQVSFNNTTTTNFRTAQVATNQSITSATIKGTTGPMKLEVEPAVTFTATTGLTIQAGGTLSGSGTISGGVTNSAGVVAPGIGSSPGTLTINGPYTQSSAAASQMKIAGPSSSQHDELQIAGQATLAGTLNVTLINNYAPSTTDTFPLAAYTSHQGEFDSLTGDASNWSIHYGPTDAVAIVNQWASPNELGGDFVVGSNNATVTGNWTWDGLLIKDGPGDLTLNLGPATAANNASLAILSGAVHLAGQGALVLSGLTFGDLGNLTNDPALDGQFGFYAAVVPEPQQIALLALFVLMALACPRRAQQRSLAESKAKSSSVASHSRQFFAHRRSFGIQ